MSQQKPNILLIFTDQQRADTIHALGNDIIQTPNLDRLCKEGIAFERAFTPSPVCVPGRCGMYYGLYSCHSNCYDNSSPMPQDRPTLMKVMTEAGYRTHGIGKMHFTPNKDALHGFETRERQEEISGGPLDDYVKYLQDKGYAHIYDYQGQRSEMYYIPQIAQMPAEDHPTNWVGSRSVEFIKNHDYRRPFYLMSSFIHPHPPFAPPTPWNKLYRAKDMSYPFVPEGYEDCLSYFNKVQNRSKYRDKGIDKNLLRTMKAYYYACISFIDYQVGRIISQLEEIGQLDNTIIIFATDHGEMLGDYNSFGKRTMLNRAARIPLLVRFPNKQGAGLRCTRPASLVDIMPTVIDFAGIERPQTHLDGENLWDVATGKSEREFVYSQFQYAQKGLYMIASENYKYIYSAPDQKEYFFDNITDPMETINFASYGRQHPQLPLLKEVIIDMLNKAGKNEAVEDEKWKPYPVIDMPEDPDKGIGFQDNEAVRDRESKLPFGYTASFPGKKGR